jgi:uncharacterized membrane protein YqaE (UPF0057 family)
MIYLVAILLPWLAFMIRGNIGLGLLCLILQITLIGWIPATIWAIVYITNKNADERNEKMLKAIRDNQVYSKPADRLTLEEKARLFDEKYKGH